MIELRRVVVPIVLAAMALGICALLGACKSTAQPEQVAVSLDSADAEPEASAAATLSPVNTVVSQPDVTVTVTSEMSHTPTTIPEDDDGLEFVQLESIDSLAKDEGVDTTDKELSEKGDVSEEDVDGQSYTWEDGDRTLTVFLQTDLVVEKASDGMPDDVVKADDGGSNVVRSAVGQSKSNFLPVFRSESGELMTLPGGVLLVLNADWSEAETNSFFSSNDIKLDRVSELGYVANGFFIETEPGFPSLELANELAALDGVEVSSPNWGRETVPK